MKSNTLEIDFIHKQMNNLFQDYYFKPDEEDSLYKKIFQFLEQKENYTALEYRFYCWLSIKFKKDIKINCLTVHIPIDITKDHFEERYLLSKQRKNLIDELKKYIAKLKEKYQITKQIEVLIGGSFSDCENETPNDLDAVILIPEGHESNDDLHEIPQRLKNMIPAGIDIKFLPFNYSVDNYKAYSNISYLGNKAENKHKGELIENNTFTDRDILKISI